MVICDCSGTIFTWNYYQYSFYYALLTITSVTLDSTKESDTEFVRGNPNFTDMINGNRLDEYILYFLVLWDKKKLNNLKDK